MWIEKKRHYNGRVSLHEAPTKNQNKMSANQQDIFRPNCSSNDIILRLKSRRCTIKTQKSLMKKVLTRVFEYYEILVPFIENSLICQTTAKTCFLGLFGGQFEALFKSETAIGLQKAYWATHLRAVERFQSSKDGNFSKNSNL